MTRPSPYETLGVSPADDADTIRRAWCRLVKAHHPDTNAADDPAEAAARLIEINAAYEALRPYLPKPEPAPKRSPARRPAAMAAQALRAEPRPPVPAAPCAIRGFHSAAAFTARPRAVTTRVA